MNPDIRRVEAVDDRCAEELKAVGYRFLDRILLMEIDLKATEKRRGEIAAKLIDIPVELSETFPEDLSALACEALPTDRRFHLEPLFDAEAAKPRIEAYIKSYREKGALLFSVRREGQLLGFTIVEKQEKGAFENVLGVTRPDMHGRMAAFPLYNAMLNGMREAGFRKYIGRVSSSNLASINLHINLGAKVAGIYDEYITLGE